MTDWTLFTDLCKKAKTLAAEKPGRYGGRYVGRTDPTKTHPNGTFSILDDDDPDKVPSNFDVLAQVTPSTVNPIGRARNFIESDGTVNFG